MPDSSSDSAADPPSVEPEEPSFWERFHGHLHRNKAMSATTKIVVTIIGTAVLTAGLIMMVTPGPGILGIVAGLAILATEWDWADRWLVGARRKLEATRKAAAEMDPALRRRRLLLTTGITVLVVGLVALYIAIKDWPGWSIDVWDKAQSFIGFLPDLPGM